jgi:hypothetical protein
MLIAVIGLNGDYGSSQFGLNVKGEILAGDIDD